MNDLIYYRIYCDKNNQPTVVEMQWFDEYSYKQTKFLNEEKYSTEKEAQKVVDDVHYFIFMNHLERLLDVVSPRNVFEIYQDSINVENKKEI